MHFVQVINRLLDHHDSISNQLISGDNVDVVSLYFAKAFDVVDFEIVLPKLSKLYFLTNYLD